MKIRTLPESNYRAIWHDNRTYRMPLDFTKPITKLEYPEFYDIKITSHCKGGCPWCYMDSNKNDSHYSNIVNKVNEYFGAMTENQRPFQVAIGGGEPTSHPDFFKLLFAFYTLGIVPNYTTNGMWTGNTDIEYISNMMDNTSLYCGGVAVSTHPHLERYWVSALSYYLSWGVRTSLHIIISDKESVDFFDKIYSKWNGKVDNFTLLPYIAQGRATANKEIEWDYLLDKIPHNADNISFGANFYPYLKENKPGFKISLYEPEIMSKFLDLKDMKTYSSSFNVNQ